MGYDIDFNNRKAIITSHVKKFLLYPQDWKSANNQLPFSLAWNYCKFNKTNHDSIPKRSGVYCFVLKPEYAGFFETTYLFYIGKTNRTLYERFKEYLNEQDNKRKPRDKVYQMLTMYKDYLHFYYAEITSNLDVDVCEEKLINAFVPPVNSSIPKAKIKPEFKNIYES